MATESVSLCVPTRADCVCEIAKSDRTVSVQRFFRRDVDWYCQSPSHAKQNKLRQLDQRLEKVFFQCRLGVTRLLPAEISCTGLSGADWNGRFISVFCAADILLQP